MYTSDGLVEKKGGEKWQIRMQLREKVWRGTPDTSDRERKRVPGDSLSDVNITVLKLWKDLCNINKK